MTTPKKASASRKRAQPATATELRALAQDVLPLLGANSWRERNAVLFPSDQSLRWYLRKHRAALVRAGAIVLITGQWQAVPSLLDPLVLKLGQAEARSWLAGRVAP